MDLGLGVENTIFYPAVGFGGFNGGQERRFFGGGFGNNFGGGLGQHNLAGAGLPKAQPTQNCVGSQCQQNKPKGLKVAKEDQRLIGLMVDRLDGQ